MCLDRILTEDSTAQRKLYRGNHVLLTLPYVAAGDQLSLSVYVFFFLFMIFRSHLSSRPVYDIVVFLLLLRLIIIILICCPPFSSSYHSSYFSYFLVQLNRTIAATNPSDRNVCGLFVVQSSNGDAK